MRTEHRIARSSHDTLCQHHARWQHGGKPPKLSSKNVLQQYRTSHSTHTLRQYRSCPPAVLDIAQHARRKENDSSSSHLALSWTLAPDSPRSASCHVSPPSFLFPANGPSFFPSAPSLPARCRLSGSSSGFTAARHSCKSDAPVLRKLAMEEFLLPRRGVARTAYLWML